LEEVDWSLVDTDGVHWQVDYGHDETALLGLWQIYSPDS
jgi:hypothetical protein